MAVEILETTVLQSLQDIDLPVAPTIAHSLPWEVWAGGAFGLLLIGLLFVSWRRQQPWRRIARQLQQQEDVVLIAQALLPLCQDSQSRVILESVCFGQHQVSHETLWQCFHRAKERV